MVFFDSRNISSKIIISDGVHFNNDIKIICERSSVIIDEDCLIGNDVQIFDSDFHDLDPGKRLLGSHFCQPVHIHRNVFIGSSVIILKGVSIGEGSVVAAGSVVTANVPANTIVAGVPARVVKKLME